MKQKMRERVRPKMGKIDIDYQKLHDAFFRWQIPPKMTIHGDLYYEVGMTSTKLYLTTFLQKKMPQPSPKKKTKKKKKHTKEFACFFEQSKKFELNFLKIEKKKKTTEKKMKKFMKTKNKFSLF